MSSLPEKKTTSVGANSTADRAIEILLLFSQTHPVWTSQEIAAHFKMPRSTTYRYLQSLRAHALIVQDSRGGFCLGPRLLHMAQMARVGNPIVEVCAAPMRALAERFQENILLNERLGTEVIALDRLESPHRVGLKATRTHILPWPANSSAKVLLAFCEEQERAPLWEMLHPTLYTPRTLSTLPLLQEHLQAVRQQGYAISDEERDDGVWGASVPLFAQGTCHHALSVAGPKYRIPTEQRQHIVDALLDAARTIGAQLA